MENNHCRRENRGRLVPRDLRVPNLVFPPQPASTSAWWSFTSGVAKRIFVIGFAILSAAAIGQESARPPFPEIRLPGRIQGEEAINALGAELPAVAAFYRRTPEELRATLRRDKALWVDPSGRLFYICDWGRLPADASSDTNSGPAIAQMAPLDQTFLLHSRPGATKTIYLDFVGFTISGTAWNANNGGADIVAPPWDTDGNPSSFSTGELTAIQQIWLRVAEDYAPYDVDVTTEYPGEAALTRSSSGDQVYGTRALISPIGDYFGNPGGIAYVGVFDMVGDFYKPALIFPENLGNNEKNIAEAISHEVGHNLGLSHDGQDVGGVHTEYYAGQGNWAPIMGVAYSKPISQWSKGEYPNPSNTEDDLTVITQNGLSYRADDFGDTIGTATPLSGTSIVTNGVIERTNDVDFVSFQTGAGTIQITATPSERGPNLHILLSVYDSLGTLITNRDVADTSSGVQPVSISRLVTTGTYYVSVDGIGSGDPMTTGYTEYGSLGQYTLAITLPASGSWLPTPGGPYSWTNSVNWASGSIPDAADATAAINNNLAGDQVISLDTPFTVGRLLIGDANGSHGFTIQDGLGGPLTFDVVSGSAAIIKTAGTNDVIAASLVLQDDLAVSNSTTATLTLSGPIAGGRGVTKTGSGLVTLAGTNSYTGTTAIASGSLALAATALIPNSALIDVQDGGILDVSAFGTDFGVSPNQTLGGSGVVAGDVVLNSASILAPGAANTAGTLTFNNNLALTGGANWNIGLAATNTPGGGTNDLVVVGGKLSLAAANTVHVNPLTGSLASPADYTVLTYGGTLSGGAANLTATSPVRYSFVVDDSIAGELRLHVNGGPTNLAWRGDGSANAWNVVGATNWFNGTGPDQFFQFDTVTFDDSGSNSPSIALTGALTPAAVIVNAAKNYTFAGSGRLSGAMSLTKLGAGALTLNNSNDFTGSITVGDGLLKAGNTAALGATSAGTTIQSGGALDIGGFNLGADPVVAQGNGAGSGAIINSGGQQLNALRFVTLSGDATFGGTGRWDIRANPTAALAGNGFKLAKTGANEVWLVALGATGLGPIDVQQGLLGIQSSTTLGNAANALTLWPGTSLVFWDNTTNVLNKVLQLTNAVVRNDSGANTFAGPITLNSSNLFNVASSLNLRGPIGGSGSLAKTGTGSLILSGTNNFTGTLYVDTSSTTASDGIVKLANGKALTGAASVILRNNNGGTATLQLDGSVGAITLTSLFRINCRNNASAAIENVSGINTIAGPILLDVGGNTVTFQSDAGLLIFAGTNQYVGASTGARAYTFSGAGNHQLSAPILNSANGSPIGMAKTGTGTLSLNAASSYANGTALSQGIVQVNAAGGFGTGAITCNSAANTARIVLGNGVTVTNSIVATTVNPGAALGLLMVNDNTSATFSGPIAFNANATAGGHIAGPPSTGLLSFTGPITSAPANFLVVRLGNVRFSGGGSYTEIQPRTNTTSLGANNGIAANAVVDLAGNGGTTTPTSLDLNGFNQALAGLKNAVTPNNAAWVTNSAATTNTLTLSLGSSNLSFGGSIVGRIALTLNSGAQTLTKSGTTGLNGLYTFNGNTTLNGGSLVLGAGMTLPNTPVINVGGGATLDVSASGMTLGAAQTLTGNGSILGNFIANGTVSPGSSIGGLTFNSNLTLTGKTLMEITHAGPTNDVLNVSGTLTRGGVLIVTNVGPALAAGDSFKLFNAGTLGGAFASMTLPPLDPGLRWNTNQFSTNSTITVVAVPAPQITPSLSGTNLTLQFPTEIGVSYLLQSATNLNSPTIWTSQQTNTGNGAVLSLQIPINVAERQKYFRLLAY